MENEDVAATTENGEGTPVEGVSNGSEETVVAVEPKIDVEGIAKVCHEANKAYCESIGDNSQPSWDDVPDWQKSSAKNGVQFHIDNPDAQPCDSHNSWLKQKTEEGWKYGEVKNPETKEHPCFVPYEELAASQQKKYALFIAVVHALIG